MVVGTGRQQGGQRLRVNGWDESRDEGGRKVEKESQRIR